MMSTKQQRRIINAGNKGYAAAQAGQPLDACPYANLKGNAVRFLREQWIAGWKEGQKKQ